MQFYFFDENSKRKYLEKLDDNLSKCVYQIVFNKNEEIKRNEFIRYKFFMALKKSFKIRYPDFI